MSLPNRVILQKYLRHNVKFPHIWCPGCGNGIVLGALLRAIEAGGYPRDQIVLVGGIGCISRAPVYVDFNTLHTAHGRAIPFATGIKAQNPELKVIAVMGDGDALSIGLGHLLHAARRNIGVTAIVVNNMNYGMTGGQVSPLTPQGSRTTTTPGGSLEEPFAAAELVAMAGASFSARSTTYHVREAEALILSAIAKDGFSFVEIIAACPVGFGRRNNTSDPVEMMRWQREHSIPASEAAGKSREELNGKFVTGVIAEREAPEWTRLYRAAHEHGGKR